MTEMKAKNSKILSYLKLINLRRPNLSPLPHLLHMPHPKITNTNRPRPLLLIQPLQRPPHLLSRRRPSAGRMNQKQIHIPFLPANQLHAVKALLIRFLGAARRGKYLGGEEDLVARDSGLAHGVAHLRFVGVELRAVDVTVADFERGETGLEAC